MSGWTGITTMVGYVLNCESLLIMLQTGENCSLGTLKSQECSRQQLVLTYGFFSRIFLHLIFETSFIESLGLIVIDWKHLVQYQNKVLSWVEKILENEPCDVSLDGFVLKKVARGLSCIVVPQ
jgi:hypothetical protein